MSRSVKHVLNVDDIYAECDYITIHVPLLDSTKGMINAVSIAKMKEGVVLLNFARDLLGCRPILRTFRRYVIPTGFMTVVVLAVQHCFDGAASLLLGVAAGALSYGLSWAWRAKTENPGSFHNTPQS